MKELASYQFADGVATIVINNGKANAIDHTLIDQLNHCLDRAENDQAVVILTAKGSIFSAGYDLREMSKGIAKAMPLVNKGSLLSRRLMSFPQPVIAACNGHAMAKGAFLLLSADIRVGVNGPYKIGFNEVAIGITLHYAGLAMAQYRLSPNYFQRSVICAEIFDPQEALAAGFLDKLVNPDQLTAFSQHLASGLKGLNKAAHQATKLKARASFLANLEDAINRDNNSPG